jgi:hypothetical protein
MTKIKVSTPARGTVEEEESKLMRIELSLRFGKRGYVKDCVSRTFAQVVKSYEWPVED